MNIFRFTITIICFFTVMSVGLGQQKTMADSKVDVVFFIGEDEKNYEKLVEKYNTMLFAVCNNNMELAYDHWSLLLKDIEEYSAKSGIDLKGVKLWLNVFWAKDGRIDHIVFYPKPNSKNLNYDNIKVLLTNFVSSYQSPLKHTVGFSHYGSGAFPVFSKSVIGPEK
jgi:hypothetical protein